MSLEAGNAQGQVVIPELYFRIKDNGAHVFRVSVSDKDQRLKLEPLAVINQRTGDVKPQGKRKITRSEQAEISAWLEVRRAHLEAQKDAEIDQLIERMNLLAQRASARATDAGLEAATPRLLMALHDLRSALTRK